MLGGELDLSRCRRVARGLIIRPERCRSRIDIVDLVASPTTINVMSQAVRRGHQISAFKLKTKGAGRKPAPKLGDILYLTTSQNGGDASSAREERNTAGANRRRHRRGKDARSTPHRTTAVRNAVPRKRDAHKRAPARNSDVR